MNGVPMQQGAMGAGGMNQMLEIFKMQYLMKFLDSSGSKSGGGSMMTMAALLAYDHLARYIPQLLQFIWMWIAIKFSLNRFTEKDKKPEPLLLPSSQPPPQNKTVRAFIQFERNPEKSADSRIDAVMHHVCNLPDVRSLRYNGVEMIPNFKDSIMIENDVWFEIINPSSSPSFTIGTSKDARIEPILYRLSTYDHDITWLHKFVENSMDRFEQEKKNKLGSETYYFDQIVADNFRSPYGKSTPIFTKSKFTSNRTLNNVYLRQIGELKQRVEFFMRRRDWYDSKGIPHTLGIVMYGVPGCGKTSTIKGIANETKRHIFNIALSEIKTKEALKDLFYNEQVQVLTDSKTEMLNIPLKHRLYVIEDIDAMNSVVIKRSEEDIKKEKEHKLRVEAEVELLKQTQGDAITRSMMKGKTEDEKDKLDLATLLNVLDGVRETPGRIIILSTNYPERLDEALLRPGRFDMMVEFEKHSCEVLKLHLEKHYDAELTKQQLKRINNPSLDKKWTPAEVSQILFRRVGNIDGAIDDLVNEDPKKLFKFSQFKDTNAANIVDAINTDLGVKEEEKGTLLDDLLEEEPVKEEKQIPKNELVLIRGINNGPEKKEESSNYDNDDDYLLMSGGTTLELDRPSTEQLDAEKKAHSILFKGITETFDQLDTEFQAEKLKLRLKEKEPKTLKDIFNDDSPEAKAMSKLSKEYEEKKMNFYIQSMMTSPMFNNEDGYTAINSLEPLQFKAYDGDLTTCAADECGKESLDAFFQPPQEF
jgi:hypothetical protein